MNMRASPTGAEMEVKRRRILPKDFDSIEEFICDEMSSREGNSFRRDKETIWKELDRQLRMKPMIRKSKDGRPIDPGWHNTIELGELAKASEIITADVMRMLFPDDRTWFEPHVLIPGMTDEQTTGVHCTSAVADDSVTALRHVVVRSCTSTWQEEQIVVRTVGELNVLGRRRCSTTNRRGQSTGHGVAGLQHRVGDAVTSQRGWVGTGGNTTVGVSGD